MMRNDEKGFFAAHWDWLVAGVGVAALCAGGAWLAMSSSETPEAEAAAEKQSLDAKKMKADKVKTIDMTEYGSAMKLLETPSQVVEPDETQAGFLASARRKFCEQGDAASDKQACGKPIAFNDEKCPYCGVVQPKEIKVVLDSDGDGIPDEQEKAWGMNQNDPSDANADMDSDGFTNIEEYLAKTDPKDPASHPDYLDDLRLDPKLKATYLTFVFVNVLQTPGGLKFIFKDPKFVDPKTRKTYAMTYSVFADEPIGDTGFVAKRYEKKFVEEAIKGTSGTRKRDISVAVIERKSDGAKFELTIDDMQFKAVDIQARLMYERGVAKEFNVVQGDTFDINGEKHVVSEIKRKGKTVTVVLDNGKKILEALEQ